MAKELPYYKFEPNQWENGNIQMCTHEEKGVFVDLCSMYWSRLGDVPYKLAVQKICGGNANALQSLCDSKIFEVIDGNIYIKFLSEQLNEFEITSERNSKIAKEGWEKRRKQKEVSERNANALPTQSERNAIREEKIREDNRRKENKYTSFSFKNSLVNYGFEKKLVDEWMLVRKNKKLTNSQTAFNSFISQVETSKMDKNKVLEKCVEKSWGGFNAEWLKNDALLTPDINTLKKSSEFQSEKEYKEYMKQNGYTIH
jgi:hypothetical protein